MEGWMVSTFGVENLNEKQVIGSNYAKPGKVNSVVE